MRPSANNRPWEKAVRPRMNQQPCLFELGTGDEHVASRWDVPNLVKCSPTHESVTHLLTRRSFALTATFKSTTTALVLTAAQGSHVSHRRPHRVLQAHVGGCPPQARREYRIYRLPIRVQHSSDSFRRVHRRLWWAPRCTSTCVCFAERVLSHLTRFPGRSPRRRAQDGVRHLHVRPRDPQVGEDPPVAG